MVACSVLEAIKLGIWDFEPQEAHSSEYEPTKSMPGSDEKLSILAQRLESGLPLWHPEDRRSYEEEVATQANTSA
ncbi:MAG: hypothetical protein MPJ24_07895 [Pirellulaceae bacterium]|nr:hypothetical protein [Pirellulaceae bacterium]